MELFRKITDLLHRRHWERRHGSIEKVTVLTKPVVCFNRELEFSLPPGFRLYSNTGDALSFESAFMRLTVQRVPFHRHLHRLTARDLAVRFRTVVPVLSVPELRRGYLKHSPMISAQWETRTSDLREDRAALYMTAVQQTVYIMLMTGNSKVMSHFPAVIYSSVQVHPERVEARRRAEKSAQTE